MSKGGRELRLLDEVDLISGVSGGSFTAAYYGLFGDRTFQDFEQKFLKKNIQGELRNQILFNPANWSRLFSPYFDRSDLAAEYYDKNVFEGATFADLARSPGPMILINATDMVYGTRLTFIQDAFDIICSDLSAFPVARACAASSAVPILLTPITLKNYAGSCDFVPPAFLSQSLEARDLPDRQFDLANNIAPFMDAEKKALCPPGGRRRGGQPGTSGPAGKGHCQRKHPDQPQGRESGAGPGRSLLSSSTLRPRSTTSGTSRIISPFAAMFDSYSSIAIFRYNIETVALLRESFKMVDRRDPEGTLSRRADLHGPRLLRGHSVLRRGSQVRRPEGPGRTDRLQAPAHLPSALPPEDVDKLRQVAGRILNDSSEFKRLLGQDLQVKKNEN